MKLCEGLARSLRGHFLFSVLFQALYEKPFLFGACPLGTDPLFLPSQIKRSVGNSIWQAAILIIVNSVYVLNQVQLAACLSDEFRLQMRAYRPRIFS